MPEILLEFENQLPAETGVTYEARVCGRGRDDGLWEGWIEFVPVGGNGTPMRTRRETTQPSRELLIYWARGLTIGYLDGALSRVLKPLPRLTPRESAGGTPAFPGPADEKRPDLHAAPPPARAVLDPFAVFAEGDTILAGQLDALDEGQLRNIIRAYQLDGDRSDTLHLLTHRELCALIMERVRTQAG